MNKQLHINYITDLNNRKDELFYWITEQLRISGVYWGVTALSVLDNISHLEVEDVVEFVQSCFDPASGGYGGNKGYDGHILYTLSAVQILAMYDRLKDVQRDQVVKFVSQLQNPDGSFCGDCWGEVDTRFSYCAVSCLSILGALDQINAESAISFILSCQNFDGGFGSIPGAESHAGQIFCCVGALTILGKIDIIDADNLGWWLAERQLPNGGLNGRPEKLEDVCYSWWVLSSLSMLHRLHWIDKDKLIAFINCCEDKETGGFSDRPGDQSDIFHTLFALTGLSILGVESLNPIDPVYCLPVSTTKRLGIYKPCMNYQIK